MMVIVDSMRFDENLKALSFFIQCNNCGHKIGATLVCKEHLMAAIKGGSLCYQHCHTKDGQ